LLVFINFIKTRQIIKKYKKLMRGIDNKNLEAMLLNYLDIVQKVESKVEEIACNFSDMNGQLESCIQKVGIVRYNPFEQVGSNQSFSIAMLNKKNDGIVLTGLYSRDGSAVYAKPIISMESTYPLSDEEKLAIQKAVKKN